MLILNITTKQEALKAVETVIQTRKSALENDWTKNGRDYRELMKIYGSEAYNWVKNLYWHLSFKGLHTWDHYLNSKSPETHNHIFDDYLLPGKWVD
jgi:hypothetical protein